MPPQGTTPGPCHFPQQPAAPAGRCQNPRCAMHAHFPSPGQAPHVQGERVLPLLSFSPALCRHHCFPRATEAAAGGTKTHSANVVPRHSPALWLAIFSKRNSWSGYLCDPPGLPGQTGSRLHSLPPERLSLSDHHVFCPYDMLDGAGQ